MKSVIKTFLVLSSFFLTSCISMVPENVVGQLTKDFVGAERCMGMFMALPKDCRENPSWCVDLDFFNKNIVSYQDGAQTMLASFAVARKEDNTVAICNWNRHGTLRGWNTLDKAVLSACEKQRLTYMSKNQISLNKCEIYAHGNEIR